MSGEPLTPLDLAVQITEHLEECARSTAFSFDDITRAFDELSAAIIRLNKIFYRKKEIRHLRIKEWTLGLTYFEKQRLKGVEWNCTMKPGPNRIVVVSPNGVLEYGKDYTLDDGRIIFNEPIKT